MTGMKKPRKRAPARDVESGKFEAASPLTDPDLMDFAIRIVRAIKVLEEPLAGLASNPEDEGSSKAAAFVGFFLSSLKDSMLRELAADPESLKEVKKRRLDAKRLGNVPIEEMQRIQALAADWLELPSAASRAIAAQSKRGAH